MIKFTDLPAEAQEVWKEFIDRAEGLTDVVMYLLLNEIVKLRKEQSNVKATDSLQKE